MADHKQATRPELSNGRLPSLQFGPQGQLQMDWSATGPGFGRFWAPKPFRMAPADLGIPFSGPTIPIGPFPANFGPRSAFQKKVTMAKSANFH